MALLDFILEHFLVIIVVFVVFDLFLVAFVLYRRRHRSLSMSQKQLVLKQWEQLAVMLEDQPAMAVMEADKLLDHVMRMHGAQGSVADKLRALEGKFRDYQGLWSAHKLRNRIAHEVGKTVSKKEAQIALKAFDRGLKDLGAL